MNFKEALEAMRKGQKVRLPEWRGYWFMDKRQKVLALTKDGEITNGWAHLYMGRENFEIATGCDFGWAITALKAGKLVCRKGWNGKGMFVFMRPADSIFSDIVINNVKLLPQSLKDYYKSTIEAPDTPAIKFTAYLCMKNAQGEIMNGWAATQTDMLAEDWELFDQES